MHTTLSLGFANAPMSSAADLRRWLEAEASVDAPMSEEVSLRLPDFVELQGALRELLTGSIHGLPSATAVRRLNEVSARVPRVLRLDDGVCRDAPLGASGTSLVLARIAWSAIELAGGRDRSRLRRCGSCGDLFLATRTDRVWCSDACGNRVRVARHQAKLQAER